MRAPDYRLEQIHRNANEIARFADWLREGYPIRDYKPTHEQVFIKSKKDIQGSILLTTVDQIICGMNRTRVGANRRLRQLMGLDPENPVPGDRIICLRNNNRIGVFNGMQGRARSVTRNGDYYHITFHSNDVNYRVIVDPRNFHSVERPSNNIKDRDMSTPFDYAYAITCHKAQGDEFDSVIVLEQQCSVWNARRWSYTAATRAKDKLYWILGY